MTTLVKFTGLYVDPWVRALQSGEFKAADRLELVTLFKYLEFCLEQVRCCAPAGGRGWTGLQLAPQGLALCSGDALGARFAGVQAL
jgi:hypothetical protein